MIVATTVGLLTCPGTALQKEAWSCFGKYLPSLDEVSLFAILRLEGICPQGEHVCGAGVAGRKHDGRIIATCTCVKLQAKLTADDGFRNSFFGNSASILEERV